MVSCSIADGRSLEESAHLGGTVLQAAHVGNQAGLESRLVPWRAATRYRLLEIVVEEFIGIVLGRVGCGFRRCRPAIPKSCRSLFRHDVARLRRPAGGFVFVA